MPIRKIKARQIFDACGDPTVEVDLITDVGLLRSSVPSVIFPSNIQAKEIRDENEAVFRGRSVLKVIETINNRIAPEILKSKLEVNQQREIDLLMQTLDGTPNKSKLGANAILGVSIACCKASAAKRGLPLYRYIASLCGNEKIYLPVPIFKIFSGGRAAGNNLAYEAFLILPTGATTFAEAMKMGIDIYREIEEQLAKIQEAKLPLTVLNEGTFAPQFDDNKEALATIDTAIKNKGYEGKVKIAVDIGASTFFKDGKYDLQYKSEDSNPEDYLEPNDLQEQYKQLFPDFPALVSIEDPFGLDNWDDWTNLVTALPDIQIVADELTATNAERLDKAIEQQAANSFVIRLSHIGSVTEAIDCVKQARDAGWGCIVSAGQGETEDTFIADFAVGTSCGQFKTGAPCRSERVAKYNQILRIEEELGKEAKYAGEKYRNPFSK
ncbi:PREDICTED: alpha-enolase-like [Ceratosolen solmsi marchali]|uniref:Enolase n=1 Tax=Ceratosolen solmsi marchali TaxID=326594 RepID=A0AAJ6VM20_9HYME|nr:PREDICTED: alpha-enolase-like [Ceratosolen solmsi marchali]